MDRPPRQEWIIEVLREAQLRLSQGELVASICKSLAPPSSYRRWRRMYGERVIENAAVASESPNRGQAPLPLQLKISSPSLPEPTRMARSQTYPRKLGTPGRSQRSQ